MLSGCLHVIRRLLLPLLSMHKGGVSEDWCDITVRPYSPVVINSSFTMGCARGSICEVWESSPSDF